MEVLRGQAKTFRAEVRCREGSNQCVSVQNNINMSYYFSIIGTKDNPLFEIDFGTSKIGGDGVARFREEAKHMNQFIVHSSLDVVEDAQWTTKELYVILIPRSVHTNNDIDTSRKSTPSKTTTSTHSSPAETSSSCSS